MSNELPIRVRPMLEGDIGFVFNTWLKSFRYSSFAKPITNTVYFNEQHKIIERLIKKNDIFIACDNTDPNQIYGYICAGKVDGIFAIHYIYVKHTFRKMGIGKLLLNTFSHDPSNAAIFSHHTHSAEKLAAKFNLVYHPFILINEYNLEKTGESNDNKEEK